MESFNRRMKMENGAAHSPEAAAHHWFQSARNFDHLFQKFPRPSSERLQNVYESLAVTFYVFGFVFTPLLATICSVLILFCPFLWVLAIPYVCWYIYDYRTPRLGSRPTETFRQLGVWTYMAQYFPVRLHKTAEIPPDRNYIIACHPHGILSFATYLTFCTDALGFNEIFSGLKRRYAVTLPVQYWFPIRREILLLTNTISSDVEAIDHVLSESEKGTVVAIVPGGASEALESAPDNYRLTLKNRKGFIKLALTHGVDLVPMYHFGETSTYRQIPNPEGGWVRGLQNSLKGLTGVTFPFFYGTAFLNRFYGFLPFRTPIHSVVGKPLHVPKIEEPTSEEIDEYHEKYCNQLTQLFNDNKTKYGIPADANLEFI